MTPNRTARAQRADLYWNALKARLAGAEGMEEKIEILRIFPREARPEIERRDLSGELPLTDLFSELTDLAEAVLRGSHVLSAEAMARAGFKTRGPFAVVGMGKFGGRELTYRSDLDIVFFYEDPADQEQDTRLAARIISALTLLTQNGPAYPIDTTLRPSGNAGTLVTSLSSFQEYHHSVGRTWERQALIKARPIVGPKTFRSRLQALFHEISFRRCDAAATAAECHHLRQRMECEIARERPGLYNLKTGYGGIVDIEFAAQYLQLLHGLEHPKLRNPNTIFALRSLREAGFLEPPLAEELEKAYLFLRGIETRLRLHLDQPTDELVEGAEWLPELERRFFGGEPLIPRYLEIRKKIRSIYEKVLGE